MKYKLTFSALACNRYVHAMMQSVDLLREGDAIGTPVTITLTTTTEPTPEYLETMAKQLESIPAKILPDTMYVGVQHVKTEVTE